MKNKNYELCIPVKTLISEYQRPYNLMAASLSSEGGCCQKCYFITGENQSGILNANKNNNIVDKMIFFWVKIAAAKIALWLFKHILIAKINTNTHFKCTWTNFDCIFVLTITVFVPFQDTFWPCPNGILIPGPYNLFSHLED